MNKEATEFMAKVAALAGRPTVFNKVHESVYRSYNILQIVRNLLKAGAPTDVVLEILDAIDTLPPLELSE